MISKEEQPVKPSSHFTWQTIKTQLSSYIPTSKKIIYYFPKKADRDDVNRTTLAAFLCLNYVFPYFMWSGGEVYCHTTLTTVRLLGIAMCIPLLLKNYWPIKMLQYFSIYWYSVIMYILPFSTTLSCLIMGSTTEWLINISLTIMMLRATVGRLSFAILSVLGTSLGIALYYLLFYSLKSMPPCNLDSVTKHHLTYAYIFSILTGFIFFRKREKVVDKRLETLELLGKVIGRKVSNILAMNKAYAGNIQFYSNQLHIEHTVPSEDHREFCFIKADKKVYLSLQENVSSLMHNSEQGVQTLHRLLTTLRKNVATDSFTILSMKKCVTDALVSYNLTKDQKDNLFVNLDDDFQFYGSYHYIQHILFNLLDNAYKHRKKKCTLEIWLSSNRLYVKDYGFGIAKEALPYIFDPFFTTSEEAMGIGLTFCRQVMEAFGGIIICKSKQGQESFAEFILTFPTNVNSPTKQGKRPNISTSQ